MGDLDCGDNSCLFAWKKGGMRTNGGCRCMQDAPRELRRDVQLWAQKVKQEIAKSRAEGEAAGREAERRDVVATLKAREEAEREAYAAYTKAHPRMSAIGADEHPGEVNADAYESARKEIEAGEHAGAAEKERGK